MLIQQLAEGAIYTLSLVETFNSIIMLIKLYSFVILLFWSSVALLGQKIALVDTEYLMSKIPAYATMNRQIEEQSKRWQSEVTKLENEANVLYKKFQTQVSNLTSQQRKLQEDEIINKERSAYELKRKYFGPEGELIKKRKILMKPIQTEIWKTLKDIANIQGIHLIIDKASGKIMYADPKIDLSTLVLEKMGY